MESQVKIGFASTYPPTVSGLSLYAEELSDFINSSYDDISVEKISANANRFYKNINSADISSYDIMVYNIGNHPMNQRTFDYALKYPSIAVMHEFDISALKDKRRFALSDPLSSLIEAGNIFIVHSEDNRERLTALKAKVFKINEFYFKNKNRIPVKSGDAIGVFGYISKSKGAGEILDSYTAYLNAKGSLNLFFAGNTADFDLKSELRKRGLEKKVGFFENPSDMRFDYLMESCRGAVNLRIKESGETSANMLKLFSMKKCIAMNEQGAISKEFKDCYFKIDINRIIPSLKEYFEAIEKRESKIEKMSADAYSAVKINYSIEQAASKWRELFLKAEEIKKYNLKRKKNEAWGKIRYFKEIIGRLI